MERKQEVKRIIKSLLSDIHTAIDKVYFMEIDQILKKEEDENDLNFLHQATTLLEKYLEEYKNL